MIHDCPECGSEKLWRNPPMYEKSTIACTYCLWKGSDPDAGGSL